MLMFRHLCDGRECLGRLGVSHAVISDSDQLIVFVQACSPVVASDAAS